MLKQRAAYLILLTLLVPIGIGTKFYSGPGADWVANSVGGSLYVVFWILLALAVAPHLRAATVSLTVLVVTCVLEVLQLWHPAWLAPIRGTFIGHALLGNHFSWWDFPYYLAGALLGFGIAAAVRRLP
ncbi:MAG: DUF2809 domain-containing protein [Thiohalocapsa sp.]|nr:DUF2809 domain-containing protein [Thiohalocapsa sp.]MCF7992738.1 DUF2809 domain-containing protein [Thiohalocapsa sp.]